MSVDRAAPSDLLARQTGLTGAAETVRQFVDFRSRLDAANDVDGTGVDRALVNTQTASAETRTGRDPTMGLCAAVAAVQSTEAHHYPLPQPAGNRVSKTLRCGSRKGSGCGEGP